MEFSEALRMNEQRCQEAGHCITEYLVLIERLRKGGRLDWKQFYNFESQLRAINKNLAAIRNEVDDCVRKRNDAIF